MLRVSCAVAWLGLSFLAPSLTSIAPSGRPAGGEVRALWVERTALTSPEKIAEMVRTAHDGGFNTLLVQVRALGEAYYTSAIDPRAAALADQPAAFDPLATTIAAAHDAGLRVHAWINVNYVGSATTLPKSPRHVAVRHPEWLMVPGALASSLKHVDPRSPRYVDAIARWTRPTNTVEGLYLSPATDAAQAYLEQVVTEIATKYPVDGVHLDYLRFPSDAFDYSATALAAFRAAHVAGLTAERQRLDARAIKDPAAWTTFLPEGWTKFRRDRITALATRLVTAVRRVRPDAVVSAAVGKSADEAVTYRFQDWQAWASARLFDALCPMIYTPDAREFSDLLAKARGSAGTTALWVGVGAYRLPVDATADRLRTARRMGTAGFVVFSYDNLAGSRDHPATYFAELRQAVIEPPGGGTR